jgi:predicted phosphodiesterase
MERNQEGAPGQPAPSSRCGTVELLDPDSDAPLETSGKLAPRIDVTVTDGTALVFSDAHHDGRYPAPTAHRAIVLLAKHLKPELIISNGDLLDQPTVSKHARIMWEERPKLVDELVCGQQRLREIERAAPKARRIAAYGNHCSRLATHIASRSPELEGLPGMRIEDFFGAWDWCWQVRINHGSTSPCFVQHRLAGGAHAAYNNAKRAGATFVSGHTHSQKITPVTTLVGTVWGVDCGCVADVNSPLFDNYTECGPKDWRSGFCVLTWAAGVLMPPELVQVVRESPVPGEGRVWFRGRLWEV